MMTYAVLMSTSPFVDVLDLVRPTSYADLVVIITFLVASLVYLTHGKVWDKGEPLHHLWFEIPQLKNGFKKCTSTKEITNIAEKLKQTVSSSPS
jgi:NADPH-ferrihemoprotein reductase